MELITRIYIGGKFASSLWSKSQKYLVYIGTPIMKKT